MQLSDIVGGISDDKFIRTVETHSHLCPMYQENYHFRSVMTKAIEISCEEDVMSLYETITNSWQYEAAKRRKS
jgi:hypothetical protein